MSSFKKIFATVTVVTMLGVAAVPAPASAITATELQAQIDALLAQIAQLQSQLTTVEGGTSTGAITGIPSGFTFSSNLTVGSTGNDVKYLQLLLNSDSATKLANSGAGSPGSETTYFGPITKSSVIKFQDKYASDILTPVGLTSGTGYFGPSTRSKANSILGTAVVTPPATTPPAEETGGAVETPTSGAPIVSLSGNALDARVASDTPAGVTIPDNASANFTKFILTTGDQAVTVSKVFVTRKGLTSNSDMENVKILDANGVNLGSVASFNVNNKATVTFTPNLSLSAKSSSTFFIRAGVVDTTAANKTVLLGVEANSDITSSASTVTGAPVYGNTFTTVTLAIGTATVDQASAVSDSQPDVGDADVVVNDFKIEAGSGEAITVHQITVLEAGTASLSDTSNIELWSVTENKSYGTVANWTAGGKASWSNLNIKVAKGVSHRFQIRLDIVGGAEGSLTINADVMDGSDILVDVTGDTYGFYITPTDGDSWSNSNDGRGSSDQTIQGGSLTVAKSSSTPATGNIAPAADQVLAVFDFIALGEEMQVSALTLDFDFSGMVYTEVTSVRIYDANGNIVAGPMDTAAAGTVAFTDTFIVPIGTTKYTVKTNIATSTSGTDTVDVGISTPNAMTVKGMSSNNTITPTPTTEVEGNTLTVTAADLDATTLTTPVARSISKGSQDYIWATFSLSATDSGENINVTALVIEDTLGDAADEADMIDNAEIWADLTSASSSRGDAYETKVSQTKQFADSAATDETLSFTLTQTVVVPKGKTVGLAFVADLAAGATTGDIHTISLDTDSGDVTATGASTGTSVTVTPTGAGQAMTVTGAGTLTITNDASQPSAKLMIANGTTEQTLGIFRFAANNVENIELDDVLFEVTNGGRVLSYKFYVGSTLVAEAGSGTGPKAVFADGAVIAKANSNVKLTVKGVLASITQTSDQDTSITVNLDNIADVNATGLASGSGATISGTASANTHIAFESYPQFSVNASTPKGDLTTLSSAALVAIFDVTAVGGEDITFTTLKDSLTMNVSQQITDSNTTANTWTLKDVAGNTLDSNATVAENTNSPTVDWDFSTATFTVAAGQTASLYVYANTLEFEDDGDSLQVWLDDGLAAGKLKWSIDGDGGAYEHPDIIFRGDIFAGSLVNPS